MKRIMLKSKIHMATVTDADLNYNGSIGIDPELIEKADFIPFEKVDIYNCTNGNRFSTYVIKGDKKGQICLNGAAARMVQKGDIVIIASYAEYKEKEARDLKPTTSCLLCISLIESSSLINLAYKDASFLPFSDKCKFLELNARLSLSLTISRPGHFFN